MEWAFNCEPVDICEGNLTKFHQIEKKFNLASKSHSIFHSKNEKEKNELLSNAGELIFAWVRLQQRRDLAKKFGLYDKCKPMTSYMHMKAVIHLTRGYPRHPKPALKSAKIEWLDTITPLLKRV